MPRSRPPAPPGPPPLPAGHPARRPGGAGLLEMVIALALVALLALGALPVWRDWIARRELDLRAQVLASALTRARTEAIRRGFRFNVCKSADGLTCADTGDWTAGWIVHVDPDATGAPRADEPPIARDPPVDAPITIDGNGPVDDYVSFVPTGEARRLSGALQMGTFTVCRRGFPALRVVLAATGRVRVAKTASPCP